MRGSSLRSTLLGEVSFGKVMLVGEGKEQVMGEVELNGWDDVGTGARRAHHRSCHNGHNAGPHNKSLPCPDRPLLSGRLLFLSLGIPMARQDARCCEGSRLVGRPVTAKQI